MTPPQPRALKKVLSIPAVCSSKGRRERADRAPACLAQQEKDLALNLKCSEYVDRPATENRTDL